MGKMKLRRSMTRLSGIRDASIICIACEGADTEPSYFNALKTKYVAFPSRIHLDIVEREDASLSAPDHIIAMLDREKRKNGRHPDDQYWIVIDYDRWGEQKLRQIAQKASQKQYMLAVSRPCFEAWLLLHIVSEDELESLALQVSEAEDCNAIENMLRAKRGHYKKKLNDAAEYVGQVENAIRNAKKLGSGTADRWPQSFGSHVYLLCEQIIEQKRFP
jgi:hypothetical protein